MNHFFNAVVPALVAGSAGLAVGGDAPVPAGVDLLPLRAVLHEDVRVLWLGDSYAVPYSGRPSGASLLAWPMDRWTAFSTGDGPSWFCARFDELEAGISTVGTENAYRLNEAIPGDDVRFALPIWRLRELVVDSDAGSNIDVMRYRLTGNYVAAGTSGRLINEGDTAFVRPILMDAPGTDASVASITLSGIDDGNVSFDPRSATRPKRVDGGDPENDPPGAPADGQIFASPLDYPVTANASDELEFEFSVKPVPSADLNIVYPSGYVAYRAEAGEREPGLYFSTLTDGSWSYAGFGSDVPSGTPGYPSKVFSRAQLAHWIDATTLDPEQPVIAFYLLNVEDIPQAEALAAMEAMIDQTAGAAADAGVDSVRHCLVIPWLHRISGQDNPGRFPEQRDAAYAIAASRDDVSAVSIFDATDGNMFNGNAESRAWLAANGYDDFRYGSYAADLSVDGGGANGGLLDVFRSHPGSQDGAAFFADIIAQAFIGACPADFAAPYGVLDLADISGFITRFIDQAPSADLAAPREVFDLADVTTFVSSFLAGCP